MIITYDDQDRNDAAETLLSLAHWQEDEQFILDITNPYDFLHDFNRWFRFAAKRAEQIEKVRKGNESSPTPLGFLAGSTITHNPGSFLFENNVLIY